MLKNVISQGDFALWPQLSLLLFFLTFSAILVWVRRRSADNHYRYMADLALDEGAVEDHDGR